MGYSILLAKKPKEQQVKKDETLPGHTRTVLRAAQTLAEILGDAVRDSLMLSDDEFRHWKRALLAAAWLHDWGKANDHFQRMLRSPQARQGIRHEAVSLYLAYQLAGSLLSSTLPAWAYWGCMFAVGGHHLKFPDDHSERMGLSITFHVGHVDFRTLLHLGSEFCGIEIEPPQADITVALLNSGPIQRFLNQLPRLADQQFSPAEKNRIASIKAALLAADLAGSALPRGGIDPDEWIRQRLLRVLDSAELARIIDNRLKGKLPRPFQSAVQQADARSVILEAGCGAGKSIAAYLWAAKQATGKRLFFSYPTTGTSSEGFSGYLSDPEIDALLIHSRADVDYELLENMPAMDQEALLLRAARMEALETWPIPLVVCTAHTVLSILQNVRRGLYAWPSVLRAAFVFDEVHSYSDRLFEHLLRFLIQFPQAPVLLMTATMPELRRTALLAACEGRGGGHAIIRGPAARESAPRYLLIKVHDDEQALDTARAGVDSRRRILWIANTVARAQVFFDAARSLGLQPALYHSRFKYVDRLARQRQVIDAFDRNDTPVLAITTQVAEMSLDISADILISDLAPIPNSIQRLGRLNRYDDRPSDVMPGLFCIPDNPRPYDEQSLEHANIWLNTLADGAPKSQADLAAVFRDIEARLSPDSIHPREYCDWPDGLWRSRNDNALEEGGTTIEIILASYAEALHPEAVAIPMLMNNRIDWRNWPMRGRFLVVPDDEIEYDPLRGAQWKRN